MTIFRRVNITAAVAAAGLCGLAMALSPEAAAAPFMAAGHECFESGKGAAPCPAAAPVTGMAGVPMALPGPVPIAAPAPVPVGAPAPAPVPGGAPLTDMAGLGGKGDPIGPPPPGAPVDGQPVLPGPTG
jgi:hypothetical protein